jgi:hypothetical protein
MRTTLRIDDDLMRELRDRSHKEKVSLSQLVNRLLRRGLAAAGHPAKSQTRYRETTFSLGKPAVSLDKSLALAAALEDEEIVEKMARRK